MSIIIDLNAVCLVCLQEGELQSVYDSDEQTGLTILEKISSCANMDLPSKDNKLPDKICANCLEDLSVAWRFRQNCDVANTVFQSIQEQSKDEEELAKFEQELEEHKIKIPSGLKIKRVMSESKSILLPVQLVNVTKLPEDDDGSVEEENLEGNEMIHLEEDKIEEGEEEEGEELDFAEYYGTEEVLEETDDEDNEEKALVENIEIKVEREDDESEEVVVKENQNSNEVKSVKRGRGRPKKYASDGYNILADTKSKSKIKEQKTRGKVDTKSEKTSTELKNLKSPKSSGKSERGRKAVRMSDFKPTKICEICGNIYKYQHALSAHMRRHNNERPYPCEFCEKAFVSGVELRRHMRVHTGHKPYSCQYCGRKFSDFGSNVKHERTHTGERPYKCNTCSKAFAYAHVLSVHLRTHTGEKKFKCARCGKGFTKKIYLQSHMEQHARSTFHSGSNVIVQQAKQYDANDSEISAIKTVAQEECIFTTEYIDDQVEEEFEVEEFKPKAFELDEAMSEEHLEDTQFSLVVR